MFPFLVKYFNTFNRTKLVRKLATKGSEVDEASRQLKRAVILEGVRTPFHAQGYDMADMELHELASVVLRGVLSKNNLSKNDINMCLLGNMIPHNNNINVARDAMLYSGFSPEIPAFTTSAGFSSTLESVANASNMISSGRQDTVLVGGVESASNVPITLNQKRRKALIKYKMNKSLSDFAEALVRNFGSFFKVSPPVLVDSLTGQEQVLAAISNLSAFALDPIGLNEFSSYIITSFDRTSNARHAGFISDVIAVECKNGELLQSDYYGRSFSENLSKLVNDMLFTYTDNDYHLPAKDRPIISTKMREAYYELIPNYCDGAAATVIMSEQKAAEKKLEPRAFIKDYYSLGSDVMKAGPTTLMESIYHLLKRNNLTMQDVGVFEINETSLADILFFYFFRRSRVENDRFNGFFNDANGSNFQNLNAWGGTFMFGNAFSANGIRLINMACNRMRLSKAKYAVVSSLSQNGMATSILLENFN